MLIDNKIEAGGLLLRCLREEEVSEVYLNWLNDPEVNQYLEVRHNLPQDLEQLRLFIRDVNSSEDTLLLGIFIDYGNYHIGNIKLGSINKIHKRAEIGIIFGEKSEWGKGYATTAIKIMSDFAEQHLGVECLTAGCYSVNQASARAFEKAGFRLEARIPSYWELNDGTRVDELWLVRVREGDY